MRLLWMAPIMLSACASYTPQTVGPPTDPSRYAADVRFCASGAAGYRAGLNTGSIVAGTVKGAAQNAVGGVVGGPLVVGVGAAGGGAAALSDGLDLMGQASANVFRHCLEDLTNRDGSAVVANPN